MIFELKRLRNQWREMNARVEQLERKLKQTDGIVDALLSDAEYTPHQDLGMNGQHRRKENVILIDDFQVPDNSGYQYDDYGPGKALTMEYLSPVVDRHGLSVYFSKASSADETGKKRGYCVVASPALADDVNAFELLHRA